MSISSKNLDLSVDKTMKLIDPKYNQMPDSSIQLEDIVIFLKETLQIKGIYQNILFQKIIDRAAQEKNLTVTPDEIQRYADSVRHQKRLEKAADTFAWLADQRVAPDDWEAGIRKNLLRQKLSQALFAKEVERFFAQNKLNFDQVLLYQIIVPYEKLAWEIFYNIEEEEMSFYLAAHLYDIDEKRRYQCGYEGKVYRWSIEPELSARIFAAKPREIITPFRTEQGYHILMVEEFIPAQLTREIHEEILGKMFEDWLASELNYLLHNSGVHNSGGETPRSETDGEGNYS
jgi:parvulin-like peptidyl-prolyl isomerase